MISVAYASEANAPITSELLQDISEKAISFNRENGITGYLSWKNQCFFQYLEGPENAVKNILEKIKEDPRHNVVEVLELGNVEKRRFARWDMMIVSGKNIPDIRIQDLIEDVMKAGTGEIFAKEESHRLVTEMLDQLAISHNEKSRESQTPVTYLEEVNSRQPFVVALGASAGGLDPLRVIVRSLQTRLDTAYVVVQHHSPKAESMMDMILKRDTTMPVVIAARNRLIEPGTIYLVPPGEALEISAGRFVLSTQEALSKGPQYPIDVCLRSLSREYGDRAVAVILSGTGTDGSRGARALSEAGGLVIVQQPNSAEFDGMPRAAIATDVAYKVLTPAEIPDVLNNLGNDYANGSLALRPADRIKYISDIAALLEDDDVDFAQYKSETIFRRIERRRVLANITKCDDYVEMVRNSAHEREELKQDILITVTSFFRDIEAWERLKKSISNLIESELNPGETFRVWVTACASGEEAYTVGIVLKEVISELEEQYHFKVYATDIERRALEFASAGNYTERAMENVSEERRKRFFTTRAEGYTICREIREHVIFAPHNFIKNAPFTRMHLVTCRNVLIYMQPDLQQLAIKMLHFALKVNGILFLGPSESLGSLQSEFYPVQREWNQYKKLRNLRLPLHLSSERNKDITREITPISQPPNLKNEAKVNGLVGLSLDVLSHHSSNINVLVDRHREVKMVISDPFGFLQMNRGEASLDITRMVPEELRASLTFAISRAFKEHTQVVHKLISCQPVGQRQRTVDLEVIPYVATGENIAQYALVVVGESKAQVEVVEKDFDAEDGIVDQLRDELQETKKALQAAINDLEFSNNEQRSINEQLSAANEELQSTNEELQSVNEELYTVNFEYQTKIHELSDLNHDLDNLLDSTNLGVIFLDSELRIRRFTDVATQTVNLLPSDVGRPFVDLANNIQYKTLVEDLRRVLSTGKSINREISRNDHDMLQVGIHPYRAGGSLAEGVLIMFRDIKKRSAQDLIEEDLSTNR